MDRRKGLQFLSRSRILSVAGALVLLGLADIAYTQPATQSGGAEVSQIAITFLQIVIRQAPML